MKNNNAICAGQKYLEGLPRIGDFAEHTGYDQDVLLLPDGVRYRYNEDQLIEMFGLDDKTEGRPHDLIRVIRVRDALALSYEETNVLTPLLYAEALPDILWHLNTQGILLTRVDAKTIQWIKETDASAPYGKHAFDRFWLPCCGSVDDLREGEIVCVFNRRVSGWDGSLDRPVVELLGAGGHVPTVWDGAREHFRALTAEENLAKEAREELGFEIAGENVVVFGGYSNQVTHELVVLAGIMLDAACLPAIQAYAIDNEEEDTQGIYMGRFSQVIRAYQQDPRPFAGGEKAAPTNFPNNKALMERVRQYVSSQD